MSLITQIPSKLLESIINFRNKSFENGESFVYRSSKPVISIGNLTFGGSGKTPLTIALARELIEMGLKPGVIGSGYKRNKKDVNIIHNGKELLTDWHNAGDEMFLIAEKLQVPAVVHKKKFEAAKIIEQLDIDVIILDDGFQHRYLYRDLDLVIIDQNTIDNPWLPPRGNLREPLEALSRADLLLADENLSVPDEFTAFSKYLPVRFKIILSDVYNILSEETKNIEGEKVLAFCGIANPSRFNLSIFKTGAFPVKLIEFNDHHKYYESDLVKLFKIAEKNNVDKLITTEKDAVKLKEFSNIIEKSNFEILALPIEMEITNGKNILHAFIHQKIIDK